jgi:hypothetical protein
MRHQTASDETITLCVEYCDEGGKVVSREVRVRDLASTTLTMRFDLSDLERPPTP